MNEIQFKLVKCTNGSFVILYSFNFNRSWRFSPFQKHGVRESANAYSTDPEGNGKWKIENLSSESSFDENLFTKQVNKSFRVGKNVYRINRLLFSYRRYFLNQFFTLFLSNQSHILTVFFKACSIDIYARYSMIINLFVGNYVLMWFSHCEIITL